MGGSSTLSTSETRLEALKLQSSAYGVTIPVVGGMNRVAGNLVYYNDFVATPHTSTQGSGGKGGGVKTQSTTYSYTAAVIMGICQGPIGGIARIWVGKQVLTGGWSAGNVLSASESYATPASGAMSYTLVHGATIIGTPTITCTVGARGGIATLALDKDYTLSAGVIKVLQTSEGGPYNWHSRTLKIVYQYGSGSVDLTPLQQLGLTLANGDMSQAAPAWLTAAHPTQAVGYPGLVIVHSQSYQLGTGAQVENHNFEVQGSGSYRYGSSKPDCNPAEFAANILLNGRYGAAMSSAGLDVDGWITYCAAAGLLMSPVLSEQQRAGDFVEQVCKFTNSAPVWSYDRLRVVPYGDTALTANGVTYTPNTTPLYDVTDDVWLQDGTDDPVVWELKQPSDRYNSVHVEFSDRTNYYNTTIAAAQDDADIAANGLRVMNTVSAPWICDAAVARTVAQILLQRSLLITGKGTFNLPWAYCLLEPMDLITLTDSGLGFNKLPVRITAIGESDDGTIEVEVEDWPLGAAAATQYPSQVAGGFLHNYNVDPGSVATPVFIEAPVELTGTGLEVYAAVKGVSADWGGCNVWVSLDGTNYRRAGTVYGPSRVGTLSATILAGSTNVPMQGLGSLQLNSGSAADATALSTLCFMGTSAAAEYFAYTTATLTGAGAYTLSGLVRAAYGTAAVGHANGDTFIRVDDALAKSGDLTLDYIGRTIFFKFTSFNVYQRAEQGLASVSAYSYTVLGYMAKLPPPNVGSMSAAQYQGGVQIGWSPAGVPDYVDTEVRQGASYAAGTRIFKGNAQTYSWPWPAAGTYTLWAVHYDRFGNQSASPQSISITVDANGLLQSGGIALGAAGELLHADQAAGTITPANTGAAPVATDCTVITSISYPAQAVDVDIEVTATASWQWACLGSTSVNCQRVDYIRSTNSPTPDRQAKYNTRLMSDGAGNGIAIVRETATQKFTLAAGTATTIEHRSAQYNQTGRTLGVSLGSLTAKVTKR